MSTLLGFLGAAIVMAVPLGAFVVLVVYGHPWAAIVPALVAVGMNVRLGSKQ